MAESIAVGQQAKTGLLVECMKPFADTPPITISFTTAGANHRYPMRLPVVPSCFCEPLPLDEGTFMQRWKALSAEDKQAQLVFNAPVGQAIDVAACKALITGDTACRLAQATGVDKTETTISAAGTFRTGTAGPDGNKLSVGLLLRLELNVAANAYRLTVRAVHGDVAKGLGNVIKNQLS
jgi:AP-2 complex subunit alpha